VQVGFVWLSTQAEPVCAEQLFGAWLYEPMQKNHAMCHVWLPEYNYIPITTFIGW
jgi:hypothetical protein